MHTFRDVALQAVKKAGEKIRELAQSPIQFKLKTSHDILAEADLASEKIILTAIREAFPDHAILSEEAGKTEGSEYLWIVDPIDGTINFSRQLDEHCISVALSQNTEVILGIVYQPMLDRLYIAEKGKGAFLNDQQIHVSRVEKSVEAMLATDNSSKLEARQQSFDLLGRICQDVRHVRIFGSCAMHLAHIAEGKIDIYFKIGTNYWDFAAGMILVTEAGGRVTDFQNQPFTADSQDIVVSNTVLHDQVLDLVKK